MTTQLKIIDFLNKDFKSFSTYDCIINLPNMIDGFKISQRKALYTVMARNKKSTVERYASDIASYTQYHHGAANLEGVLVGLAQDYPTSNNVNFLTPLGQFGNMLSSAAASGRYISVEPNANFRTFFKKEDDLILQYEYEDGEQIEPKFYIPVIPTILVNGGAGIGTGYACKILNYNPKDIARNVQAVLDGKAQKKLTPWYKGYTGKLVKVDNQTTFTGTFERVNTTTLKITALPIGTDLASYKDQLSKMIEKDIIKDYDDNSTVDGWEILIYANRAFTALSDDVLIDKLKLVSRESENFTVWDDKGKIKCFNSPEELIEHFVNIRIPLYETRRQKLMADSEESIRWMNEKLRFIMFYLDNVDLFKNKKKDLLIELLLKNKFEDYARLLQMQIWSLTRDKIDELKAQVAEEKKYLATLKSTTAEAMYALDLKDIK